MRRALGCLALAGLACAHAGRPRRGRSSSACRAASGGKAFDPTATVSTMVLGKLAEKLAPELGLDVLRVESVEPEPEEGELPGDADTRVEVGKYISERAYLSYAHVFGASEAQNRNEARVEYRITRRWMVETVFGDAGVGGLDALWSYRF